MTGVGAAIAFASAIANAFALVLQAVEARQTPPDQPPGFALLRVLVHRPRWVLGTLLVIIAWPLQIVALGFAPITVVQPILASFQLFLLALARFWLKEPIGWREYGGALAIAVGVSVLILAGPQRSVLHPSALRLGPPLALLAIATLVLYSLERAVRRDGPHGRFSGLYPTLCAGLGYAFADFADKLVSNNISTHNFLAAAIWLLTVGVMGFIAFTSEQSALQTRPASAVGPLIGALQEPLPVILALWGGLEVWQGDTGRAALLVAGIVLAGLGATVIARSPAIATVSHESGGPPPSPTDPGSAGSS